MSIKDLDEGKEEIDDKTESDILSDKFIKYINDLEKGLKDLSDECKKVTSGAIVTAGMVTSMLPLVGGVNAESLETFVESYDNVITTSEEFKKLKENEELQESELEFKSNEGKFNERIVSDYENNYLILENKTKDMIGDIENQSREKSDENQSKHEMEYAAKVLHSTEISGEQKIELEKAERANLDLTEAEKIKLQEGSDILNNGEFV